MRRSATASHAFVSKSLSRQSSTTAQRPPVIFSGIQPTGVPHLGNYLGALRQWVSLQNSATSSTRLFFSVVDLHSLTARQPAASRRRFKREMLAALLAIGLDPARSTLFHQSAVTAHAELHWILSCDASVGWLARMTQWKSKLGVEDDGGHGGNPADPLATVENPRSTQRLKLGLFSYPVLQAADILLYRATHVPVGEDQAQHIEFARDCANAFNHNYGGGRDILVPPAYVVSPARRVMSLTEPERKMSKSHELARSRILLSDSREEISSKFRTALTDSVEGISYEPQRRPGVSNLVEIISHLDEQGRSCQEVAEDFKDSTLRVLKERAALVVDEHFRPIREKYEQLLGEAHGRGLDEIAARGAERASTTARETMEDVRSAIGI